jgi:pyridoxal phosphate enzyme (YggS family)
MPSIAENIKRIRERIETAARRSSRQAEGIVLVAVTKTVETGAIREAVGAGITDIGENYVQEAEPKLRALSDLPLRRHFIGHLQRNKAGHAVQWFDVIQSLDSLPLAEAVARRAQTAGRALDVLLEVNVAGEASKSGVEPERALDLADQVARLDGVHMRGVMGMAPLGGDVERAREVFRHLRGLFERLPDGHRQILSMGMTGDFEIAIEEGSTMVRIGTGIFGLRPPGSAAGG